VAGFRECGDEHLGPGATESVSKKSEKGGYLGFNFPAYSKQTHST
jgi:hypothetical protein